MPGCPGVKYMVSTYQIVYKSCVFTIRSLITLLRLLTCILLYQRNTFLEYLPMVVIVSVYIRVRKIYIVNYDLREWVPTSLCENPRRYYLKESVPYLRYFIVI